MLGGFDLLVVHAEAEYRDMLVRRFRRRGLAVSEAASLDEAYVLAERRQFDVALFDINGETALSLALIARYKELDPECEVVVLAGQAAPDCVTKTGSLDDLEVLVLKACERRRLAQENQQWKSLWERAVPATRLLGASPAMLEVQRLIERAGPSDKAILIQGEPGAGKQLAARALHAVSALRGKPMVVLDCAALPSSRLEGELFGREDQPGLLEIASGGTLFIREIAQLPLGLQAKLLRVLEEGTLRRIGTLKERRVHFRLLTSSSRALAEEVSIGRVRVDLYYRISEVSVELPPLRNRPGDVLLLAHHFLGDAWQLEPAAASALAAYPWPGNVRQLEAVVARAKLVAERQLVRVQDLPRELWPEAAAEITLRQDVDELSALERGKVVEILARERGNKTRAARTLGIDRRKLYRLIDKYNLQPERRANHRDLQPAS